MYRNSGTKMLKEFPFRHYKGKGRGYSGGSVPDFHRFPYYGYFSHHQALEPVSKHPLLPSLRVRLNILHEVELKLYPRNTQCMSVVKIFAFLDLGQNRAL